MNFYAIRNPGGKMRINIFVIRQYGFSLLDEDPKNYDKERSING